MNLFVGTYSVSIGGMAAAGDGIYRVPFDAESGVFGVPLLAAKCVNPSAMITGPSGDYIFAVKEVFADHSPSLQSFLVTRSGGLNEVSGVSIAGELPCQIAFDPIHSRIASAQYWSGDVAVSDALNGVLKPPLTIVHKGQGRNTVRQDGPHPHCVTFTDDGTVLHVVDLGLDKIASYHLDRKGCVLNQSWTNLPEGSGPRHMAISKSGSRAWVVCELDETLITIERTGLGWTIVNSQSGFAPLFGEEGSAAAVRLSPDERHVYISGRRQSQIAGFSTDGTFIGSFDCGGKNPREFITTPDGRWIISANQDSNTLTSLARDSDTGVLSLTYHKSTISSPVAIIVAPQTEG